MASLTLSQRLLLLAALAYGVVFACLLDYGRPGLGIGQGFYVPVILTAAATSPLMGALAGATALFLYELAIHARTGLTPADFMQDASLTRLASYLAAGLLAGYLASRGRMMLAQSLRLIDELVPIASARLEQSNDRSVVSEAE